MKEPRTLRDGFNIYSPEGHKQLSEADRTRIRSIYENAAEDAGIERGYAENVYSIHMGAPHLVVYVSGGELVSCCLVRCNQRSSQLSWVYTEPAHRRKKFASKMLSTLIKHLVARTKSPMLYLREATEVAIGLYESVGFVGSESKDNTIPYRIHLDDIRHGSTKPTEVLAADPRK